MDSNIVNLTVTKTDWCEPSSIPRPRNRQKFTISQNDALSSESTPQMTTSFVNILAREWCCDVMSHTLSRWRHNANRQVVMQVHNCRHSNEKDIYINKMDIVAGIIWAAKILTSIPVQSKFLLIRPPSFCHLCKQKCGNFIRISNR